MQIERRYYTLFSAIAPNGRTYMVCSYRADGRTLYDGVWVEELSDKVDPVEFRLGSRTTADRPPVRAWFGDDLQ